MADQDYDTGKHEVNNNYPQIKKVLWITLLLNAMVSFIKLIIGFIFKINTLIADGLHSLSDSLVNMVGLIAIRFSQKKSDDSHPYGYEKYETIATFIVVMLTFLLAFETFTMGIKNLLSESPQPLISPIVFIAVFFTIIINYITTKYEAQKGKEYRSEFLIADAAETKSDIIVSLCVVVGLFLMQYIDFPLDGILPIFISFLILKNAFEIFKEISSILTDSNVLDIEQVRTIVMSHPKVRFCHAIRSRGKPDAIFLDFHLGVDDTVSIKEAHDEISHEVKIMIKNQIQGIKSAFIHIEPSSAKKRKRSVFVDTDQYGYSE